MRILKEDAPLRTRWDLFILPLLAASSILIPYQIAFQHQVTFFGSVLVYAIDIFFLVDIGFGFRTTYRERGEVVTDSGKIARRYRRSFFPFDLLAAIPFDAVLLPWSDVEFGGVSIVLFVRLLRLLRMVRLFVIFKRWERQSWTNAGYLRIAKLICVVVLVLHWVACAWFLVPFLEGFPPTSWAATEGLQNSDTASRYIRSLYWVIVTTTTVGFGDITPNRNIEYVFTMFVMILGASTYAFLIGNVASLVSNIDSAKAGFWNRVDSVTQYLRARRVPPDVTEHVHNYYEYIWTRNRGASEKALFHDLPKSLRLEVILHLTSELLDGVPLFRRSSSALRNELLKALEPQIAIPQSAIVSEGEIGDGLYFVSRGTIDVVSNNGDTMHGQLERGDYFGDLSLLLGERRTASAIANTYCDVFFLSKNDFERIKREYPEFKETLKTVSSDKSEKLMNFVLEGVVL
jgi:CRP-like cAMP-binding protein